jgi:hypothetical protein
MITIGKLEDISKDFSSPNFKAVRLGYAAAEYYRATYLLYHFQWQEKGMPFTSVVYPTMHQTIELLAKGIAYKIDNDFNPHKLKKKHSVNEILNQYSPISELFKLILASENCTSLLAGLEASYLGARYGECYVGDEGQAWLCYDEMANALFNELRRLTGLRIPNGFIP